MNVMRHSWLLGVIKARFSVPSISVHLHIENTTHRLYSFPKVIFSDIGHLYHTCDEQNVCHAPQGILPPVMGLTGHKHGVPWVIRETGDQPVLAQSVTV